MTCSSTWADVNGLFEDGCECQQVDQEPNDTCAGAIDLGQMVGNTQGTVTVMGNIAPNEDADWYKISVSDQWLTYPNDVYNVAIDIEADPGVEISLHCTGGCPGGIGTCPGAVEHWGGNDEIWDCGSPDVNDTQVYYVRVERDSLFMQSCEPYVLRIRTQAISVWCSSLP
jgi:hypothetical protein